DQTFAAIVYSKAIVKSELISSRSHATIREVKIACRSNAVTSHGATLFQASSTSCPQANWNESIQLCFRAHHLLGSQQPGWRMTATNT
ncbi:hypothetical protein, partial [Paraburkholderia dipogonis]